MIKIIAAVSSNGVLGVNNTIPWIGKYPEDLKRFRRLTSDCSVVMGSKTWESVGSKPLPNRINYIISRRLSLKNENTMTCASIKEAIEDSKIQYPNKTIWIIGGAFVYSQSLDFVDEIDLTIIPEDVQIQSSESIILFPWINPNKFNLHSKTFGESNLTHLLYKRNN